MRNKEDKTEELKKVLSQQQNILDSNTQTVRTLTNENRQIEIIIKQTEEKLQQHYGQYFRAFLDPYSQHVHYSEKLRTYKFFIHIKGESIVVINIPIFYREDRNFRGAKTISVHSYNNAPTSFSHHMYDKRYWIRPHDQFKTVTFWPEAREVMEKCHRRITEMIKSTEKKADAKAQLNHFISHVLATDLQTFRDKIEEWHLHTERGEYLAKEVGVL